MATDTALKEHKQQVLDLPDLVQGRVEMHFCEMPFILPSNPKNDLKSYLIEAPEAWDHDTGQLLTKSLEIFPSVANGFPGRFDAAVLRALFTLAHRANGFTDKKVFITRCEIAKLLGLSDDGGTLKRILKSLQRLSEVRYRLHNVWWDKKNQQRRSYDGFGILDRIYVVEGKRGRYRADEERESFIVFGDKLFESLNSGFVRQIDFNEMNRFTTHVAEQTYLLLKKRFHMQHRVGLSLRKYFQFHLGMSAKYNVGQMKNKLKKGIQELEACDFIETVLWTERFEKTDGDWTVVFHQKKQGKVTAAKSGGLQQRLFEDDLIVADLIERGVNRTTAVTLAKNYDEEFISAKIEILDWNTAQGKAPKAPGGWLRKAITEDYSAPKDFVPRAQREAEAAAIEKARQERQEAAAKEEERQDNERKKERAKQQEDVAAMRDYLDALTEAEREQCIEDAINKFSPMFRGNAREELQDGLDGTYIEIALLQHVLPLAKLATQK